MQIDKALANSSKKRCAHPGVLEGPLVHLSGLLLELLDDTLVNTSQLVDQVTGGRGLAGVDMSNDNDVQVCLFLTHGYKLQVYLQRRKVTL